MMLGSKGLEYIKCSNCFLIIFIYTACRASILSEIKTMGSGMRDKRFCLMTISAQKIKGGSDTGSTKKNYFRLKLFMQQISKVFYLIDVNTRVIILYLKHAGGKKDTYYGTID